ncbi:hypothetical protein BB8028_0003g14890 [Beauveria bassiana]|uniref:Uncharacterized protein n=1 Tax=Beauveria bassiana TaxID=176275 RepID=A0A2S7YA24_BEABA|nr:hypothetical protein BB8028_0003g14890 [Beauveria bassiana]
MCSVSRVQYTCGCVKDSKSTQCELRKDTPISCDKIIRDSPEQENSDCLSHCMYDRGRNLTSADFEAVKNDAAEQVTFKTPKV